MTTFNERVIYWQDVRDRIAAIGAEVKALEAERQPLAGAARGAVTRQITALEGKIETLALKIKLAGDEVPAVAVAPEQLLEVLGWATGYWEREAERALAGLVKEFGLGVTRAMYALDWADDAAIKLQHGVYAAALRAIEERVQAEEGGLTATAGRRIYEEYGMYLDMLEREQMSYTPSTKSSYFDRAVDGAVATARAHSIRELRGLLKHAERLLPGLDTWAVLQEVQG